MPKFLIFYSGQRIFSLPVEYTRVTGTTILQVQPPRLQSGYASGYKGLPSGTGLPGVRMFGVHDKDRQLENGIVQALRRDDFPIAGLHHDVNRTRFRR